ncbi:urease accessory protein UreD [Waterburya agarophytonicola K14]|uniref:Urease accessory protein UreD n=1 Tax=Waterburya agarophytonicola KI4 TaxID=2874699 RepID=A0A964BRE7_9CYAN|nr:urease accessory protein UreD [Waterburya agarophytonicola]MCC0178219.1 urease accessory protein UreD [Waterburya agarophytonicola KI4]
MIVEKTASNKYKNNLELKLKTDANNQTVCQHQYTTYPLRLSPVFRLEGANTNRAYLYLINTSPGLLANDTLDLSLHLRENTNLYLTDQAATKVHPISEEVSKATINQQITIENNSSLEFIPEPIILYQDSVLEQNTKIKLDPTAKLFLTEIILPGRLAKNEYYDFNYYFNRLQIVDSQDKLSYIDAMRLFGKNNPFKDNKLFTSLPIMGNAIAILPDLDLNLLVAEIGKQSPADIHNIETAITLLPTENGIAIRALANKTRELKNYFNSILNCLRYLTNQASLPYIPK